MKERLITLLCAFGALALFSVMFLKREGALGGSFDVPSPVTSERRGRTSVAPQPASVISTTTVTVTRARVLI